MFEQWLQKIARTLDEHGIRYMVVGGQAVLVHGEPRLTRDIDVTLGADLDRLSEVAETAVSMGLHLLVDPETFTTQTMVLPCQDPETGVRVDFILSHSPYERQALERALPIDVSGYTVRFASAEDLVIHKLFAGRPRDLEDARSVLLKHPDIDLKYIRHWLAQFAEALGEPLLELLEEIRAG